MVTELAHLSNLGIALMLEKARLDVSDEITRNKLRFYHQDSCQITPLFFQELDPGFAPIEVIYIDPMFPPKQKRSAAVKKDIALL